MSTVSGRIIAFGAISAALAVGFGAFGAHVVEDRVPADLLEVYKTGALYHFFHSLGMIAVGLLALHGSESAVSGGASKQLRWSAALMLTGIVLFSGSLYTMALTGERWLGAVTPLGGVSFLAAWALFAWGALSSGSGGDRRS